MEKIDGRRLFETALNERRQRAVKLPLAGISVRKTAVQCGLSASVKAPETAGSVCLSRLSRII
jgi:hypothetical protein